MIWVNKYVGVPFEDLGRIDAGCDCWGLARLVYDNELGITLPSYCDAYVSADEQREIAQLISDETADATWTLVDDPKPFDLLVFRHGRYGSHIGIFIDATRMLHMAGEDQSKVERHVDGRWCTRLMGIYRHCEHTSNARGIS